jgi:hypothetical protein
MGQMNFLPTPSASRGDGDLGPLCDLDGMILRISSPVLMSTSAPMAVSSFCVSGERM